MRYCLLAFNAVFRELPLHTTRWSGCPTAGVGYRFQPLDGGLTFRGGLVWTHAYGVGPSASFGAAF